MSIIKTVVLSAWLLVYFIDNHAEFCHHKNIANTEQDIADGLLAHTQSLLSYDINDLSNTNLDTVNRLKKYKHPKSYF